MSPAEELARYLDTYDIGEFSGADDWGIFFAAEPTSPASCITLYDAGGREYFQPIALSDPQVQTRVRCVSYEAGYAKQEDIREVLTAVANEIIGGSYYVGVWASSDIFSLGQDGNSRFLLTCNYRINRQKIPETT
jgi:hypothetical protein